jgi:hypothetical protein
MIVVELLVKVIRQEEEIKGIQVGKEVIKLSLYQKTRKTPPKKLLDTINSFSKITGYKFNLQ